MSEHDLFDAEFRRCLPVGEVLESQSSASSGAEGIGPLSRAETRYLYAPEEGERVDLEQAVENVVARMQDLGVAVRHEQTRRDPEGRAVAGRLLYTSDSAQGELDYRLVSDTDARRVAVDLSTRERETVPR